jgi:hypothetical protein
MNLKSVQVQRVLVPIGMVVLFGLAWRAYGWPGLVAASGALVFWILLHFTRLVTLMGRAAKRPIGFVGSAVMLNAKLKPGMSLLHVVGLTRSLGERLSEEGVQPEVYRWRDAGQSQVTADFQDGKLQRWLMVRPQPDSD